MSARASRTVLVTGARGYIGGRLCRAISQRGELALIGASRSGSAPEGWSGGKFLSLDFTSGKAALAARLKGVDTVVHLAGANQADSAADPQAALAGTAMATAAMVEAAIAASARLFIYLSTAHVYRSPLTGRIDETAVTRPHHPYAIAHRAAEDFVLAAHDRLAIAGVVFRLSNGIGASAWGGEAGSELVANDLCRQAATGDVLRLTSSGEQWRDFITLGDVANAILHAVDLPKDKLGDGLFNLGGATPLRVIDLAERIAERRRAATGRKPRIDREAGPPLEPLDYRFDKFLATGFRLTGDFSGEIDASLRQFAKPAAPGKSRENAG
jgi:UDP-glucose 4-epimerase